VSSYHDRPWRRLYQPGKPADITPEHADALSMWRASASAGADRPFLYYFDAAVTRAKVETESDALAVALATRGLAQGDRIALYLQNVPQFPIALLAAWKLGAIAVPINPMLKERELRYVLRDCGARAIISLQDLWNTVAVAAVEGTAVEVAITTSPLDYLGGREVPQILGGIDRVATPGAADLTELLRKYAGARPVPVPLGPDDIALLTYTSGTTGEPKGATNTHGNVAFNACVYRDWIGLTPDDVVLAGAPLFHITGLIGHAAVAMLVPMPMVLGYRFEPATISRLAERHHCTFTIMAITAFTALTNDPAISERDLSSLTKVYSGGAPIAPSIVERFEREVGPYIHNIYGLTETTSPSHAVPFGRRAPVDPARSPPANLICSGFPVL
jgi:long-chain acyl-CoA synthetase